LFKHIKQSCHKVLQNHHCWAEKALEGAIDRAGGGWHDAESR
jgi:hypothetical protein